MRVIPPLEMTDAVLTSSGADEPFVPSAYNAGTTYAAGDIIAVAADFKVYESLAGGNTGHTPSTSPTWWVVIGPTETVYDAGTTYALGNTASSASTHRVYESLSAGNIGNALPVLPETANAYWTEVGPTNRWAMLDLYRNTQTVWPSPLTIVLTPGRRVDSLFLGGLEATSAEVSVVSPSIGVTPVYSRTINLNTRVVSNWYEYAFKPFSTQESTILFDLPPYSDAEITITITNTGGNVRCGSCVVGSYQYIGKLQYGADADVLNFSTVDSDTFGNTILVPRRSVPKTTQTVLCPTHLLNAVRALRLAQNAKPAIWSGLDDMMNNYSESFLINGVYLRFAIGAAEKDDAVISLELKEV